jgi:hypothetical protein
VTTKWVPRSKVPRCKVVMMMKTILMRKAPAHAEKQERRL